MTAHLFSLRARRWLGAALAAAVLAGCSTTHRAPVEDRVPQAPPAEGAPAVTPAPSTVEVPPGHYMVKPGDTLVRIGLDTGAAWRDIQRWNSLADPNVIEVGQVLRVVPPPGEAVAKPVAPPKVEVKPLDPKAAAAASGASATPAPPPPAAEATGTGVTRVGDDEIKWSWPAAAPVRQPFDENRNKGLGLVGQRGDAVYAAADGRVIYANSGLRGYGNLIIIQHVGNYVTAYAHNDKLLVKEDQLVKRGQKIAEMGSSDADGVKLHFELRRSGKPLDPTKILPPR